MSCTAWTVYTFLISLHHANVGQFEAKQVLLTFYAKLGNSMQLTFLRIHIPKYEKNNVVFTKICVFS